MLVATWILAIATGILAISGPVALVAWLGARREDRDRRERERQDEERDRIIKMARDEFVPKTWVAGTVVFGVLAILIGWSDWNERRHKKQLP